MNRSPAPLISVIIPTYNRFFLLREAVLSVLTQSIQNYEIIIADDGSEDETVGFDSPSDTLLHPVENPEVPVKYFRFPHRGMPGYTRNRGAERASGSLLAFLDSDDLWEPKKLESQLSFLQENPDIQLVHTREVWLRGEKVISQSKQRHRREGMIFGDALKKCIIGPSTVLIARRLFEEAGGFREDMEIAEDYEFWLRLTSENPVGYIHEPLVVKRAGDWSQLSEKYGHIEFFRLQGLKRLVEEGYFTGENRKLAVAELNRKYRVYAAGCRKRGRLQEAEKYENLADKLDKTT